MAAKKPVRPLNEKQRRFAHEYLKDQNATQAAIRAGYSKKTAGSQGFDLLKHPEIRAVLSSKLAKIEERAEFTAEQAIRQLERMVMFDVRKLFHPNGSPKEITELDDETATVVAGLDVVEQYEGTGADRQFTGYLKKYKLSDRLSAVNTALKMFGKLSDKHEITGKDGGPIQTEELSPNDIARRIAFTLAQGLKAKE
jgi:phage terminase small subunit